MNKYIYQYLLIATSLLICLWISIPQIAAQKTISLQFDCKEICGNGLDDDGDGYIDCDDLDCLIAGFQSREQSTSRNKSECSNCVSENLELLKQIKEDPIFQRLRTIREIYEKCSETDFKATKNGFVPECLWDREGTPGFTFAAGLLDGISGEIQGMIDLFTNADELLKNLEAVGIQLVVALVPKRYDCDKDEDQCSRTNTINLLREELLCADCEEEITLDDEIFIEENILKGCELHQNKDELIQRLSDALDKAEEFLKDHEKTKALADAVDDKVETIRTNLENKEPTTLHQSGKISGILLASFASIPISGIKNIKQVEELLDFLKRMSTTQLDDLSLYINRILKDADLLDVWVDLWKLRKCDGTGPCDFDDLMRSLFKDLDDVSLKSIADDFKGTTGLADEFVKNPGLVNGWKSALTKGVDDIIRTNPNFLEMLSKFPYGTGKSKLLNEATDGDWTQIFSGKLIDVPDPDPNAAALANRFGGKSGVKFDTDPSGKEFDLVSDNLIGEHKSLSTTTTINSGDRHSYRLQMIAAQKHNKDAIWVFEGVQNDSHIDKVIQYAKEYQVNTVIELNGIVLHNLTF